jgi:hypothetical protein
MALETLIPDHPRERDADAMRRALQPFVPAAAAVCGPDAPLFRLLCRAVYAPAADPAEAARTLRLARFALDQAPPDVRLRLDAWPHSVCCPAGGSHAIAASPPPG